MKRMIYMALLAITATLASCSLDDDDASPLQDAQYNSASTTCFEGVWSVDGKACGSATMVLDSTNMTLTSMPCQTVLAAIMPDRQVSDVKSVDYVSAYDITGYSDQAIYFGIRKPTVTTTATIDGTQCDVNILVGWYGGFFIGSSVTYSRLSGVYKVSMPVSGYEIYERGTETLLDKGDATAELSFVTIREM